METVDGHPIQVVVRRTGLTPHVIRVWEKRYGAVHPKRTGTNRRRYSDDDIERLLLLCRAKRAGRSIGQVAHLSTDQLTALVADDEGHSETPIPSAQPLADSGDAPHYLDHAHAAVLSLDATALEATLMQARIALSQPLLIEHVIAPLMTQIGDRWRDGSLRVMHEHLASTVVRSFLSDLVRNPATSVLAPPIVVTTPTGQAHENGAMMAACTAASEGWDITYLGAQLPAEEIAAAAIQKDAKAVALSITYLEDTARLETELTQLRRFLPADIQLIFGGRAMTAYQRIATTLEAICPPDLAQFRLDLETIRSSNLQ